MIPDLSAIGLSPEAVARRVNSIGASDANILMSGDEGAILALWERKTGRATAQEDLSDVLAVMMGHWTEPLNVAWRQKQTGCAVTERGRELVGDPDVWRTATLDGFCETNQAIVECKHVNDFWKDDALIAKYSPQLHHQMDLRGVTMAHLSVFKGNAVWLQFEVPFDADYARAVRQAEWDFWMAVQADEPPSPYDAPPPPMAIPSRVVDMASSNAWASFAADWLAHRDAAKKFDKAAKELKALVEPDVVRAVGHGIIASRDKRGLTIKEIET